MAEVSMPQGRKVLVTGASGLLGSNFVVSAARRFDVTATYSSHPFTWAGVGSRKIDILNDAEVAEALRTIRPSFVFHFAAATNVDHCEQNKPAAFAANAQATTLIARCAADVGAKLILMSTDSVFDGSRGSYTESDSPNPVNYYAETKLLAEAAVLKENSANLVIRANIFGWNALPKKSLAEWVLERLRRNEATPGFQDVVFSPLLTNHLSESMLQLVRLGAAGVLHVPSTDALSKYDFAKEIARQFDLPEKLVTLALLKDAALKARRPLNTSLVSKRLGTEFRIPRVSSLDGIAEFKKLETDGFARRLAQSTSTQ